MTLPFIGNIEKLSLGNNLFRRVLYTTKSKNLQLVIMSIDNDIGMEMHKDVDQFIRVEGGKGIAILDEVEYKLSDGDSLIIPAGTWHNIINVDKKRPLKLYTIYSPANHPPDRIDIDKPMEDEETITPTP